MAKRFAELLLTSKYLHNYIHNRMYFWFFSSALKKPHQATYVHTCIVSVKRNKPLLTLLYNVLVHIWYLNCIGVLLKEHLGVLTYDLSIYHRWTVDSALWGSLELWSVCVQSKYALHKQNPCLNAICKDECMSSCQFSCISGRNEAKVCSQVLFFEPLLGHTRVVDGLLHVTSSFSLKFFVLFPLRVKAGNCW